VKQDEEIREEELGGKAVWEDSTEKREASLKERKAKMILAARQYVLSSPAASLFCYNFFDHGVEPYVLFVCFNVFLQVVIFIRSLRFLDRRLLAQQAKEKEAAASGKTS